MEEALLSVDLVDQLLMSTQYYLIFSLILLLTILFKSGGEFTISNEFSGLTAGTHEWSVKDSLGCRGSGSVELFEPAGIHLFFYFSWSLLILFSRFHSRNIYNHTHHLL